MTIGIILRVEVNGPGADAVTLELEWIRRRKIPQDGKIREREWRQMAIEIIAVSRYSWLGRPSVGWLGGGPFQPSCAERRLNRRCLLYCPLLSLARLWFSLSNAYIVAWHVAMINSGSDECFSIFFLRSLRFGVLQIAARINSSRIPRSINFVSSNFNSNLSAFWFRVL